MSWKRWEQDKITTDLELLDLEEESALSPAASLHAEAAASEQCNNDEGVAEVLDFAGWPKLTMPFCIGFEGFFLMNSLLLEAFCLAPFLGYNDT